MKEMLKFYQKCKYIHYLLFFLPIIVVCCMDMFAGPDFWFLHEYGKHIISSGIPHTDFLSMHSGLHLVMQQWLSSVIFYLIYHYLGKRGIVLFVMGIVGAYTFILYKLLMLITKKDTFLSTIFSVLTVLLLATNFVLIRPQLFTYLFLFIELLIMEYYSCNKDTKWIWILPVIALLQVNLHAALFFILFLFILPYLVTYIIKKDSKWKKLLLVFIIMLLVGFINPNGVEVFTFLFKTLGRSDFTDFVMEMKPTAFNLEYQINIIFYILLLIEVSLFTFSKKKVSLEHFFFFLGTFILAILNVRNIAFFIIGTIPFISLLFKSKKRETEGTFKMYLPLYIVMVLVCCFYFGINRSVDSSKVSGAADYLDTVKDEMVLYADFDYGSYLEYRGFHPYIDSRAEVYFKSMNKKFDYFDEYYLLEHGRSSASAFVNKYDFSHMVVSRSSYLAVYLSTNPAYKVGYSDDDFIVYEKNIILLEIK